MPADIQEIVTELRDRIRRATEQNFSGLSVGLKELVVLLDALSRLPSDAQAQLDALANLIIGEPERFEDYPLSGKIIHLVERLRKELTESKRPPSAERQQVLEKIEALRHEDRLRPHVYHYRIAEVLFSPQMQAALRGLDEPVKPDAGFTLQLDENLLGSMRKTTEWMMRAKDAETKLADAERRASAALRFAQHEVSEELNYWKGMAKLIGELDLKLQEKYRVANQRIGDLEQELAVAVEG